jgi:hypothetical protein
LGIIFTNILAVIVDNNMNHIDFWWRFIFAIPIGIALVQIILLTVVYKNETPKYLLMTGNNINLI